MTGFQTSVARNLALGMPGDFATANPYSSVPALSGELTAGPLGVLIAAWAWADDTTGVVTNAKPGSNANRQGFVGLKQRAVITGYMAESTMTINAGMEVTLYNGGDFFVRATATVTIGQKVFVNTTTGAITFAAAGATVAGSEEKKFFAMTAGVSGDVIIISDKGF
ncbi:structural cement protein Gp24 [Novosphingobium resinovorum]|uniref:Uncharacterized protein n=1 Tax=Novosphingobium resinovorum TaxID=158500 RepID=A0A1D8A2J8_9SPHN|nr:hypothetical protein [Novosphingobium resinovorum]AOR76334.1 hypothetical protein BES08_05840 [Novosphingobium resinovorum]